MTLGMLACRALLPPPLLLTRTLGTIIVFICVCIIIINVGQIIPERVFVVAWDAEVELILHIAILLLPLAFHGDLINRNQHANNVM